MKSKDTGSALEQQTKVWDKADDVGCAGDIEIIKSRDIILGTVQYISRVQTMEQIL
jgi:hypothetical protein